MASVLLNPSPRFAAGVGVHASGSSYAITWFQKRGLVPCLLCLKELSSRDVGVNAELACIMHRRLQHPLPYDFFCDCLRGAVEADGNFYLQGRVL